MLLQWGLERSNKENLPIYLESTIEVSSLYRKLGFISLDGLSMTLSGMGEEGGPYVYEEVCMLRSWKDNGIEEMDRWDSALGISSLALDYEAGIKPQYVVQAVYGRIEAYKKIQNSTWIYIHPISEVLRAANALYIRWPDPAHRPPLWGIPFSVKDSINIAGIPTTNGGPALSFTPDSSALVYQSCIDAGALFIGKTNMEQLATGMTGCRSPYGTLHSTFSKSHIVGGSSSGSAVSVSEGLVSFSLGGDTAGSIRIPAALNGIVGFKPTKGTVSARGVSPACAHQDCVSFLTLKVEDAETVWKICEGYDPEDYFAKPPSYRHRSRKLITPAISDPLTSPQPKFRFGVPPSSALQACSPDYRKQFNITISALQSTGGHLAELDWTPFAAANELLYNGTFVLERLTTLPEGWFDKNKQELHPVIRQIFEKALERKSTAGDVWRDLHRQAECKRIVEGVLGFEEDREEGKGVLTVMVVPTAPFHPTIAEVSEDPIGVNSRLGVFTHFGNVVDLVGIAVPCGNYGVDGRGRREGAMRLPFGITILAGGGYDQELLQLVKGLEGVLGELGQDE